MKLRMAANSVRLRLSEEEVARLAGGESIGEEVHFSGGTLIYQLGVGGDQVSARFSSSRGIKIDLPQQQASDWAVSSAISWHDQIAVDGTVLDVLIEKDLKPGKD